ncbi:EpsG family protein [Rosenbergiella nectarea]|uniref:EpsG family protein n=1 Tax=Rosenbergiella nectarea TaxID=988801 RepID=UPI001BDA8F13|nr:EpsG family protein [Rosenbergiella nectarea]MBT0730308.1 hypothetical protein [Rosenbergiella nectarea subsp. apis]
MKYSRTGLLSLIMLFIVPLFSFFFVFFKINKSTKKYLVIILTLFTFFILLRIPPFQDLFRRYFETYMIYSPSTTLKQAIGGHVDIFLWINAFVFYKLHIPFYFIPALYGSISIYTVSKTALSLFYKFNIDKPSTTVLGILLSVSFVNILVTALGLRFGLATALMVSSVIDLCILRKKFKGFLKLVIALTLHFSTLLIIVAVIASKFVKINRKFSVWFFLILLPFSKLILPIVASSLGGVGGYVMAGYVNGAYATIAPNLNEFIVTFYKVAFSTFFLVYIHYRSSENTVYSNFISWYLILISFTFLSFTAFMRYYYDIGVVLGVMNFIISKKFIDRSKIGTYLIVISIILNNLFLNIFLERRPILLAQMWKGFFISPVFMIYYTTEDFNSYLKSINSVGEWKGHETTDDRK